jgi:phosphonatase-like hydrolase
MIELVVMDIAGTTVEDPDGVGRCLKAALTAHGSDWTHEAVNAIMGIPKPIAITQLLKEFHTGGQEPDPADVQRIFADFQDRMIDFYRTSPEVREVPGASDVLRELRSKGIKTVLDTGFSRAVVDSVLERLGWDGDLLDATVASDEVPRGRPHPDLIFAAMERTGVTDVLKVAKVGDTPSDLQEGTAAGCAMVVGVTQGTHTAAQLKGHPHTHLIETIRDLTDIVN